MDTTALIISNRLQDLNRMKNWFPKGITVKGINGFSALPAALESEQPSLIIMRIYDYESFFRSYELIRTNNSTKDVPFVAIADVPTGDALKENVLLKNTTLMGSSVTDGYMTKIICDEMKIHKK